MLLSGGNRSQSLRRQLLTFLLFSIALLAAVSAVTGAWIGSSQTRTMLINNSLQIADNLADRSVLSLISGSREQAEEAISQVLGFSDVTGVAILEPDLKPLLSRGIPDPTQSGAPHWRDTRGPLLIREDSETWYVVAPVGIQDGLGDAGEFELESGHSERLGYVLLQVSKKSLSALSDNLLLYNIVIGLIIAVTMGLVMNIGLRRLIQPIFNLSTTMKRAQETGEHNYAGIEGALEIRQMAESYNGMMTVLEKQEDALLGMNARLESEVEIRTKELIQARDAALIAVRTKSEFLANISHELRTPLQAIIGYVELVKEELEFEAMDQQVEDLEEAIRSSQRLLTLIASILDLAKSESGRMEVNLQPVSLNSLLEDVLTIIRPLAAEKGNALKINTLQQDQQASIDREKTQQILINLLSNACKFTEKGTIGASLEITGKYVEIQVSDSGIGISREQQALIFDEFRQVDGSVERQFGGTGLGLAISRRFAEMMNGSIEVESDLGKGACFTLRLPLNSCIRIGSGQNVEVSDSAQ